MTGAGGAFLPMAKRLFALWSWFIWGKLAGMRRFVRANLSQSRTVGSPQVVLLPCRRVRKRLKVVSASSCRVPSSDCHSWSVIDRCHRRIVYRSVWQQRLLSADATKHEHAIFLPFILIPVRRWSRSLGGRPARDWVTWNWRWAVDTCRHARGYLTRRMASPSLANALIFRPPGIENPWTDRH